MARKEQKAMTLTEQQKANARAYLSRYNAGGRLEAIAKFKKHPYATAEMVAFLNGVHGEMVMAEKSTAVMSSPPKKEQPKYAEGYSLPAEPRPLLTHEQKVGLVKLAGVGAAGSAAVAGGIWLFVNFGLLIAGGVALWFVGSALFGGRREEERQTAPAAANVYYNTFNINAGNGNQNL